jgi:glucokinase
MAIIGIDLGGTKLASALFENDGKIVLHNEDALENRNGDQVAILITHSIKSLIHSTNGNVQAIGVSVPGIAYRKSGTVWAPNIRNWESYPLLKEINQVAPDIPVTIESDRSCYISGEIWKGNAAGCENAIFIAVGTGIGAGIVADGRIIHGANDIAGAIGWMALQKPYEPQYVDCGCFEYNASGNGIAKVAKALLKNNKEYSGRLRLKDIEQLTSHDVFDAFDAGDELAIKVITSAIEFWGMAFANLVSIFNPEKIILGGGVFGPAIKLIPDIKKEMLKWAQPISVREVDILPSQLGPSAGMYGAAYLALRLIKEKGKIHV